MRRGLLFCLCGPAGSGKTSLGEVLLAQHGGTLSRSISVTSRPIRAGEVEGKSYHFVARERFLSERANGLFFEAEEIHGNWYGTLKSTVDQAIADGHDLLLIIDIKGALNFKCAYPADTVIAFVVPPAPDDLRTRLQARGSIDSHDLERRLKTAQSEYAALVLEIGSTNPRIDYLVINDTFERAAADLEALLRSERVRLSRYITTKARALCP